MTRIAVLGAGIIGLSTAVQLQEALPRASITIVAEKLDRETTSDGAAGIFRPTFKFTPGVPEHTLRQWVTDTRKFFHSLAHLEDAGDTGASVMTLYRFTTDPSEIMGDPLLKESVYSYAKCNDKELKLFPGGPYAQGERLTTLIVESRFLLPYLMTKFKANGGILQVRKVYSLKEFAGHYDVVVNCAGLGNRELVGDKTMRGNRGLLIQVHAPWIKTNVMVGHGTYVIAGRECVHVGGTRLMDVYDTTVTEAEEREVFERACKVVPSLKKARRLRAWAGLRPHREPVRVEKEVIKYGARQLKVVHNYGHGANGVCLSWGTAKHATRLVVEMLQTQAKL